MRRTAVANLSKFSGDLFLYVSQAISAVETSLATTPSLALTSTTIATAPKDILTASDTSSEEDEPEGGIPIGWVVLGLGVAYLIGRRST